MRLRRDGIHNKIFNPGAIVQMTARNRINFLYALPFLILVAVAYTWDLNTPTLWGDEADTAVFARNILKFGYPLADDGRNLMVFGNCAQLSESLVPRMIPWVQYYLGAASLSLFGESTQGARMLFAIVAIFCFYPLYRVISRYSKYPALLAAFGLLSPQVLLFHRNARYYPIVSLLFLVILWIYHKDDLSRGLKAGLLCLCYILFFQTHYLAAFCTFAGITFFCLLRDRASLKAHLFSGLTGASSFAVFYLSLSGLGENIDSQILLLRERPIHVPMLVLRGIAAGFIDLDYVNVLPLLFLVGVAVACFAPRIKKSAFALVSSPFVAIVLICSAIQIIVDALLVGYETPCQFSLLRYMPHLVLPLGLVPLLMIEKVMEQRSPLGLYLRNDQIPPYPHLTKVQEKTTNYKKGSQSSSNPTEVRGGKLVSAPLKRRDKEDFDSNPPYMPSLLMPLLFAAAVSTNFLTLSYWANPMACRENHATWWKPVYCEVFASPSDPVQDAVFKLSSADVKDNFQTLVITPLYQRESLIFYVGHRYLVVPPVVQGTPCEKAIVRRMGDSRLEAFKKPVRFAVLFQSQRNLERIPQGYKVIRIPCTRESTDGARPELTRHSFPAEERGKFGYIFIYERL
jgi:hypothetical protein